MHDGLVLDEQRNKQPFPMNNNVGPDGTISYTFPQLLAQTILSDEQFFKKILLVKNHGFLAPKLGIRGR
jgi:hypothetical protein